MRTSNVNLPFLTVLIPTFNEGGFIDDCLLSILNGSYPHEKLEICVIDGGSTDQTVEAVNTLSELYPCIKLLHNPKKTVPTSMNLGIQNASHNHIAWLGAHAVYDSNYLLNSIDILIEENCASTGGVITPIGETWMGQAIAAATSSMFGIGNARYRHATQRESVDTVFGGCWRKSDILRIGGFNEKWVRNQDYELNVRLRGSVGNIILDPSIKCNYFCRESILKLSAQYFQYGFWRYMTLIKHPKSLSGRQAAPVLLLFGLTTSAAIAPLAPSWGLTLPIVYISALSIASMLVSLQHRRISFVAILPLVFATIHLSWALGFTKSALKQLLKTLFQSN